MVHGTIPKYFWEYRTPDGVMVYERRRTVKYADYKVGVLDGAPAT